MRASKIKWPLKTTVEVDWIDSCSMARWNSKAIYEADATPLQCRTAGYLMKKTGKELVILQSQTSNGDVCASMVIPLVCVTKIRRLS